MGENLTKHASSYSGFVANSNAADAAVINQKLSRFNNSSMFQSVSLIVTRRLHRYVPRLRRQPAASPTTDTCCQPHGRG